MCAASEDWQLWLGQVTDSEYFQLEKCFAMAMVSSIQSCPALTIIEPLIAVEEVEVELVGFASGGGGMIMMFTNRIRSFFKVIISTNFDYYY